MQHIMHCEYAVDVLHFGESCTGETMNIKVEESLQKLHGNEERKRSIETENQELEKSILLEIKRVTNKAGWTLDQLIQKLHKLN